METKGTKDGVGSRMNLKSVSNYFIFLLFVVAMTAGCLPQSGRRVARGTNSSIEKSPTPTPTSYSQSLNFFQYSSTNTTSTLTLSFSFQDVFFLRGNEVNQFLVAGGNLSAHLCLVAYFPNSGEKNHLILTAFATSVVVNNVTGLRDYYYKMQSFDESINQANCQKAPLLAALSTQTPGATYAYLTSKVCAGCTGDLSTSFIKLYTPAGVEVKSIKTSNLSLRLTKSTPTVPVSSCSLDSQCSTLGYDCCLKGQCVDDKATRPDVNTSGTGYQLALLDINNNPVNIYKYPNFFYLCPINTGVTPTPTATPDAYATAAANLTYLRDLYNCTTPQTGTELSICTKSYNKASETVIAGGAGGGTFSTDNDDRNFSTIYSGSGSLPSHSIYEITYAGQTLYLENSVAMTGGSIGAGNDVLTSAQSVTITASLPTGAPNDTIDLRYKVDGSCVKINTTTAYCKKYYVFGQNTNKVTDHVSTSQAFKLPAYADGTKTIKVYVDESLKYENTHYTRTTVGGQIIMTFAAAYPVFTNQEVRLEFYVDTSVAANSALMTAKNTAQTTINTYCKCGSGDNCSLSPKTISIQGTDTVVDYTCVYPVPQTPEPPLNVTANVSTKSVPLRYYDTSGVNYDFKSITGATQELTAFSYVDNNPLMPMNASIPIGPNEVYGSITTVSTSPKAPTVIRVKKGQSYDIFSNKGTFSPCPSCGSDYYSFINALFPAEFLFKGGGYLPDPSRTSRTLASSLLSAQYRADDMLFGRACWIPLTMIPWTHKGASDAKTQRQNRLTAQHFLFANGYQRDWYGFDYGALIGSFDGVRWFPIGTNRRVTAQSNRLYLAVNAYFADTTVDGSYQVNVSDSSTVAGSGPLSTTDTDNDGAQCQSYHFCSTDTDCVKQVGWDYSCQTITNVKTTWPTFDEVGNELPVVAGSEASKRIVDLIGGINGQSKRCVYRGTGAPCHGAFSTIAQASTYHLTTPTGLNVCSTNNYCEDLTSAKFNDRINRFALSPSAQNTSSDFSAALREDEFGLAARVMGRPFYFNGTSTPSATITSQLTTNNISQVCIHGRDPLLSLVDNTFRGLHTSDPGASHVGDKVSNIGMTYTSTLVASAQYFSSCSVYNSSNAFIQTALPTTDLSDTSIKLLAATQNTSTNILKALEVGGIELVKDFESNLISQNFYQENRCLKNAYAACFTDHDCAPNSYISQKVSGLDASTSGLSEAEVKFWQEDLICGQKTTKTTSTYELKKNRCCRDIGKTLTIYADENSGGTINASASGGPGVDIAISSSTRYSRMNVVYDELNKVSSPLAGLVIVPKNSSTDISTGTGDPDLHPYSQHETFHKIGIRTCCTENWVRNFSSANGGGHHWLPSKMQNIDKAIFKCLDWKDCSATPAACNNTAFTCSDPVDCGIRNIGAAEVDRYQDWLGRLELTGVQQILLRSDTNGTPGWADSEKITCQVNTTTQLASAAHLPNTIKSITGGEAVADAIDGPNRSYIRADDTPEFSSALKQVFSNNEIACCLPAGETVDSSVTDEMCCTGKVYQNKCCLEDYTNVTVYLNRYISSEAQSLPTTAFDSETGYITDPSVAAQLAQTKNLCCSGQTSTGLAVSELKIPGLESSEDRVRRWVYNNNDSDNFDGAADGYDAGLRWNNHVYCVPASN